MFNNIVFVSGWKLNSVIGLDINTILKQTRRNRKSLGHPTQKPKKEGMASLVRVLSFKESPNVLSMKCGIRQPLLPNHPHDSTAISTLMFSRWSPQAASKFSNINFICIISITTTIRTKNMHSHTFNTVAKDHKKQIVQQLAREQQRLRNRYPLMLSVLFPILPTSTETGEAGGILRVS